MKIAPVLLVSALCISPAFADNAELANQLAKIHDQSIQLFAGARYYVETPTYGPE